MKTFRIFLLVLIIIGLALIFTQNIWVPKLVDKILESGNVPAVPIPITKHFTDISKTFSFDYNPLFSASDGIKNPSMFWKINTQDNGELMANLSIPKSFMSAKTNFSEAKFTVGRSNDVTAIKNCLLALNGDIDGGSKTVSGYPFTKFTLNDAGAGNFYETTSYRGIVDGDCYAVEYTIHSTNIGNYSPDQGIKEFDKLKVQSELEKIVGSFKFLINSN